MLAKLFAIYSKSMKLNDEMSIKTTGSALVREMSYKLAEELKSENPRFDTTRFITACGTL